MANNKVTALPLEARESKVDIISRNEQGESSSNSIGENAAPSSSAYRFWFVTMDLINHGLIVMVTVFLVYHASKEYSVTNVHVILCTLGYILLMSEAILILAGENLLADVLTRRTRSHLHWILQVLGAICTIAGVLVMYRAKTLHFRTHHALTGIASVGIMCFLLAFGYPVLAAAKFRKILKPVLVKFTHNFLGIACFALGIACQCLGYRYRWLSYVTGSLQDIELVCIVLTVIIGVLSLRGALVSLCGQAVQLFSAYHRELPGCLHRDKLESMDPGG